MTYLITSHNKAFRYYNRLLLYEKKPEKNIIGGNEDFVENILCIIGNLGDDLIKNENFPWKFF